MKLHRLELTGFGPFRERQAIDFDAFDADGLFLITGRTGAGKSSILDGVSFALYGSVPRYEGGDRRLRSDHSFVTDPTEVRLEFTVGGTRWRVTRAPDYERPAKRGGGMTLEPARAELEENVDGAWIGRAAKQREVGQLLDEVLGLTAVQFQQVILLAQNKFSRFLLASGAERQQLLRTLFGTRRFEQYKDDLEQRRRDAQKRLDEGGAQVRTLLDIAERDIASHALSGDDEADAVHDLTARREAVARALSRADYRVDVRSNERISAEAAAEAAARRRQELADRMQRLAALEAARGELARREADVPAADAQRSRLERARAAETLRGSIEAADRAAARHADALLAADHATADWIAAGDPADADLVAVVEVLTGTIARAEAAQDAERELTALDAAADARAREIATVAAAYEEIETRLGALPARREEAASDLATARAEASQVDARSATRSTLRAALDAARAAERLLPERDAAEERYLAANAAAVGATEQVATLLRQRLAGRAGELAAALAPGDPCPVCGSTEHPAPAPVTSDPVSDDDLAAAETARDRATEGERQAAITAAAAREAHAVAVTASGGREAASLSVDLAAADAAHADAVAARARVDALTEMLTDLAALEEAARTEAAALSDRLAALREEQAGADATRADIRRSLADLRGDHPSLADRIEAERSRRSRATAVIDARRVTAERDRVRVDAVTDRDARIAASEFDDAADVVAALLPDAARAELDAAVSAHAAALTAAKARALELELDTVDVQVADGEQDDAERAIADTGAARSAAIAAVTEAASAAAGLRDLLDRIDAAAAAVSGRAEEAAITTRLADTVAGRAPNTMKMDLETFVLAAELEEIVGAANLRLSEMSAGRYTLQHSDARQARGAASGLAIEVRDAYTGRSRSPHSLSGGETFLASLALALGLAEVVTSRAGGIRLDTLFIDEGFGSLDPETLELAMRTLDELRAGGRVVGVISHVEAMKEQIPAQLVVEATGEGPSIVRQDTALPA
ncbi:MULTISPECIES: AAA family ATPase [unclassified Microbacterium]|uniref:AAA family ATPase n=1 Tax=unclassified Microbacterium TaxID=2609290 RepID=UPI00387082B0